MTRVFQVNNLNKVDTTRYKEGDLFLSDQKAGILHNGKIDPILKQSDLKGYVKKSDVQKMIDKSIKEGMEDNETV